MSSRGRLVLGGVASGVLAAALAGAAHLLQETAFPDRLASIPEESTRIDNISPYDSPSDWAKNGSMFGLYLMNPARVGYFDRALRERLKPPIKILDCGCGGGLVSNELAKLGYEVEAFDTSPEALNFARQTAEQEQLRNVHFRQASIYEIPFPNSSFDAVLVSDVLEHLHELQRALSEISRVLRPGGVLVFDTINRSPFSFLLSIAAAEYVTGLIPKGSHDWRLFITPEELERGLKNVGLLGFTYEALEIVPITFASLLLYSLGLVRVDQVAGGFFTGKPVIALNSFIGFALKPSPSGAA